jgi:hypothetical protein
MTFMTLQHAELLAIAMACGAKSSLYAALTGVLERLKIWYQHTLELGDYFWGQGAMDRCRMTLALRLSLHAPVSGSFLCFFRCGKLGFSSLAG